ncbi:MAG: hypothetical protein HQL53_06290 [Magnetococcales bacterium]|nr:hypothetical protein [Magnetococcales bacterium]
MVAHNNVSHEIFHNLHAAEEDTVQQAYLLMIWISFCAVGLWGTSSFPYLLAAHLGVLTLAMPTLRSQYKDERHSYLPESPIDVLSKLAYLTLLVFNALGVILLIDRGW